jgi:hypothetical protein
MEWEAHEEQVGSGNPRRQTSLLRQHDITKSTIESRNRTRPSTSIQKPAPGINLSNTRGENNEHEITEQLHSKAGPSPSPNTAGATEQKTTALDPVVAEL